MKWTEESILGFALFHSERMRGAMQTDCEYYAKQSMDMFLCDKSEQSIVKVMEHSDLSRIAMLLSELINESIITPTQRGEIIKYIEKQLSK